MSHHQTCDNIRLHFEEFAYLSEKGLRQTFREKANPAMLIATKFLEHFIESSTTLSDFFFFFYFFKSFSHLLLRLCEHVVTKCDTGQVAQFRVVKTGGLVSFLYISSNFGFLCRKIINDVCNEQRQNNFLSDNVTDSRT